MDHYKRIRKAVKVILYGRLLFMYLGCDFSLLINLQMKNIFKMKVYKYIQLKQEILGKNNI